jgi:ribonuclease D
MQQLDTETNVTEHTLRELYVIQLGTYAADEQHIIDVKDMSTGVDKLLRKLFADKEIVFLAHNAKFEYMVLYKHFGIYVKRILRILLASKLITQVLKYLKGIMVWPV